MTLKLHFKKHLAGSMPAPAAPVRQVETSEGGSAPICGRVQAGSGDMEEEEEEEAAASHSAWTHPKTFFPSLFSSHPFLPPLLSPLQEQFEFALTAVAEEVNAILKALPQ